MKQVFLAFNQIINSQNRNIKF